MDAAYFRFIFDHMYWARDRVLAAAEELSDDEFAAQNGFTYKSIRGILTHTLAGESVWLPRLRGETPSPSLQADDVPDVATLRDHWSRHEAMHRDYLAGLTAADVAADVVYTGRDGNQRRTPAWQLLTLVYHHTTQHRSEAAEALTMAGHSPGDMDLLVYVREREAGG